MCYSGLLYGWSGWNGICTYKNCGQKAVARGRGRKYVCVSHADHQGLSIGNFDDWKLVDAQGFLVGWFVKGEWKSVRHGLHDS